jgi:hypothetical protein
MICVEISRVPRELCRIISMTVTRYDVRRFTVLIACLGLVALLAEGCGRKNQLETAEVTGRVTVNGQPLTGGMVAFMCPQGPVAKGPIGSGGSFRMGPYVAGAGDGVIVGRYQVVISAPDPEALAATKGIEHVPSLIPARYSVPATSGLTFEVKPGQHNTANFELTKP